MTESDRPDPALDALLRASAPPPLHDDGFVARAMTAVDKANRNLPARRRTAPVAPLVLARALVAERQGQARRARLWRWAMAGAVAGYFLMLLAMAAAPMHGAVRLSTPWDWPVVAMLMAFGAVWIAWRELRAG